MDTTRFAEELINDEGCKRDFLMYKIHQNIENPNIGIMLNDIWDYLNDHYEEMVTEEYIEWRYDEPL